MKVRETRELATFHTINSIISNWGFENTLPTLEGDQEEVWESRSSIFLWKVLLGLVGRPTYLAGRLASSRQDGVISQCWLISADDSKEHKAFILFIFILSVLRGFYFDVIFSSSLSNLVCNYSFKCCNNSPPLFFLSHSFTCFLYLWICIIFCLSLYPYFASMFHASWFG